MESSIAEFLKRWFACEQPPISKPQVMLRAPSLTLGPGFQSADMALQTASPDP